MNKFKDYPRYAQIIMAVYAINFAIITVYNLVHLISNGFFSRGIPTVIDIYYDLLIILLPIAIFLLFTKPKVGLWMSGILMMLTFIFDALVRFILEDESYFTGFYYYKLVFSMFVFFSFPVMRYLTNPRLTRKKSEKVES